MTWLAGECEISDRQRIPCAVAWPLQTAGMGVIVALEDGTLQAVSRVRLLSMAPNEHWEMATRTAKIRQSV